MQIDEKALVELIDRELDVHEAVLTDPISLRRLQAQRIARRILAYESAKPKEAEGWRDIASAPKDGTAILLGFPAEGEKPGGVFDGWWARESGGWADGDTDNSDDLRVYRHITHWRPLPEPPSAMQAGDGE